VPRRVVPDDDKRVGFLRWVYGRNEGFMSLCARVARSGEFTEIFVRYPDDIGQALAFIDKRLLHCDVYFCPTLLRQPRRVKENIEISDVAWADLDTCDPENLLVPASVVVRTSYGRYQAYWKFKDSQHALDIESLNRRIAYRHKEEGCDTTGWDLTQLLRVPLTRNYKYSPEMHEILLVGGDGEEYELKDFDAYPEAEGVSRVDTPMPEVWSEETAEEILEAARMSVHPRVFTLVNEIPNGDWSGQLWHLNQMLFAAGLTAEQVFTVAKSAACNKFARDNKPDELLWKDVIRAQAAAENQTIAVVEASGEEPNWYLPDKDILTSEERERAKQRHTVVEEYIEWAKTTGDAAPQYHEAGAFTVLSALLAGRVRLPTSYGAVLPNLWFMILADTTLTRKTTAMDLAIDFLTEIDSDCVLATDGSIEGLMGSLSVRPGRPSIFLRDEFSGLLEQMNKRDYYAGMLETLTKLYDGKFQKRVLKKETIEVREPVLILFTGGIKERIYSLLTADHINSGFVPRFCFITATSDITKLRPLGPPSVATVSRRDELLQRFRDIHAHYNVKVIDDSSNGETVNFSRNWEVQLTPEAWVLYNRIEETMLTIGIESSIPDILTPVMVRLAQSGLKAAILVAAAERLDDEVVVRETDILHAFAYVERWKQYALNVVANAGKTASEKELERVLKFVQDNTGCSRSQLMQVFRLHAREAEAIFATLSQRGLIRIEKSNRAERLYPMRTVKVGGE
jgi:hypothetical protein